MFEMVSVGSGDLEPGIATELSRTRFAIWRGKRMADRYWWYFERLCGTILPVAERSSLCGILIESRDVVAHRRCSWCKFWLRLTDG